MSKHKKTEEEIDKADYLCKAEIKRKFGLSDDGTEFVYNLARAKEFETLGYNVEKKLANADFVFRVQGKKRTGERNASR